MIFKYPYTDMYALNLDWIIQAIKEMQETIGPLDRIVNSVNGMTGDVEITKALITQILGNLVETFNGRTGDVELTAEDVNNTLIDITWTSDPGDTIDDLSQSELDEMYQSGKRVLIFVNNLGVSDQVYFLQYYEGHAQPQEYSPTAALAGVASFNGQTGNVTATGADLASSGTDSRTIAESLEDLEDTKVPVTRTVNNQPLSTNISINAANVPSQAITGATDVEMALGNLNASKVPNARQVNGKSLINDITLNDEDIPSSVDGKTTVEEVLNYQSQQIDEKADIPVIVSVTVDSSGPSMSAADQAKLTSDMIMCWWYNPDKAKKLNSMLTMIPGDGSISWGTNAATASSSTTFTIAFIHSANGGGIASVISADIDILNYTVDQNNIAHITGELNLVAGDVSTIVTQMIDAINTNNHHSLIDVMLNASGRYFCTGMLYSTKLYGSGIITRYDIGVYFWKIQNGAIAVNQI